MVIEKDIHNINISFYGKEGCIYTEIIKKCSIVRETKMKKIGDWASDIDNMQKESK